VYGFKMLFYQSFATALLKGGKSLIAFPSAVAFFVKHQGLVSALFLLLFLGFDSGVTSTLAKACTGPKGDKLPSSACVEKASQAAKKTEPNALPNTFSEVVGYALSVNPQIAFARSQLMEVLAGITVAESTNGFQVDSSLAAGYGAQGTSSEPLGVEVLQEPGFSRAKRYVASLSGRKLLYDFGGTDASIARAKKLTDQQRLSLEARVNDIGFSIADAYIRVIEARDLSALNTDNIAALEKIQGLVQANASNGNGTLADVKRVEARLVDARSVSADTEAELQNAVDAFRRLVKSDPGDLKPAPDLASFAPLTAARSLEILKITSPRLRAGEASIRAVNLELEAKKAAQKPKFILQTDTTFKTYASKDWNNLDAQAMVSMSYNLMDGGLAQGQLSQLLARIEQEEQRYTNDRDQAEADLRKNYTTIESARSKTQSLQDGIDASSKARELYTEQFSGGKRTLFELLDIQTSFFNAQRAGILNKFEERRAMYSVLQTLGLFVSATMGDKNELVADASSAPKASEKKPVAGKAAKSKTPNPPAAQ